MNVVEECTASAFRQIVVAQLGVKNSVFLIRFEVFTVMMIHIVIWEMTLFVRWMPMFQRNLELPSSGRKCALNFP
jgi:hypothetical protein